MHRIECRTPFHAPASEAAPTRVERRQCQRGVRTRAEVEHARAARHRSQRPHVRRRALGVRRDQDAEVIQLPLDRARQRVPAFGPAGARRSDMRRGRALIS